MVFRINGNSYGQPNARKNPTNKSKKKKSKDQLSLFSTEQLNFEEEPFQKHIENPFNSNFKNTSHSEYLKDSPEERLIIQIQENKYSSELSKGLDSLIKGIHISNTEKKITDISNLILSATKSPKPFSIQKSIIYGVVKLLGIPNLPNIKKKCFICIINLIDKNNQSIRMLRQAKRPELNYVLVSQKFILENIQAFIVPFGKNPLLLKTILRLIKNCIFQGEENIKKQCVQLLNNLTQDILKNSIIKSDDLNFTLTIYEEIKYLLTDRRDLYDKVNGDIRILSEK